jgi:hypothetical protein
MTASQWQRFYDALPDGRFRITTPALMALEARHPDRVVITLINRNPAKVLLLDVPLQLKEKAYESDINEYFLRRIHLRDLPGWPPIIAPIGTRKRIPGVAECRFRSARFKRGNGAGQEGVEFDFEYDGEHHKAWMTGCPLPLLHCVEATLDQKSVVGKKLSDLQEMRLLSAD